MAAKGSFPFGITGVTLSPASTVKIIAGSTGTLVCKTSGGLPSATVSWFRRTSTGDVNITSMSESISSKETGLSVVTSTLTLRPPKDNNSMWTVPDSTTQTGPSLSITDIQPSRSGQYRLLVWNTMTPTVGTSRNGTGNATFTIVVQYSPMAPTFKVSSTVVTGLVKIIEGQDQTFRCESQSNPPASYTWTYPRGTVTGQNLTLSNPLGPSDNGTFSCKAENTLTPTGESSQQPQSSSSILTVEILYGPRALALTPLDALQGTRLEQKCLFNPGNPEQTYFRWTRSTNTNTWKVQTDQTLVINNVTRSDDGNYTCQVYNMLNPTVGTSENRTDEKWFLLNVLCK
ncbi:carcinoembryonic antigen-related cell adhesion molecule 5-like [Dreissena polymorpha]|uniref:carcinoembryonic antigen-related cell adhesion molecule 5-like n=1 Tax=Dreissena polymorpha TaxID=45954 RepID=UPI002263E630|nr:carcinoembryonic antigen-related cell adhesion molecule 5-like [Dreissena polymorpha]